jgi:hypothetical protein
MCRLCQTKGALHTRFVAAPGFDDGIIGCWRGRQDDANRSCMIAPSNQEDAGMRSRTLIATAGVVGCLAVSLGVAAQQAAQPQAPAGGRQGQPAAQGAQPQAGRGGRAAQAGQGTQGQAGTPAAQAQGRGGAPQAAPPPAPGGLPVRPQTEADLLDDKGGIPEGFTRIFNGNDLSGWHISKTNHHGTTPDYHVVHGLIVGSQNPIGKGGILLTDKRYKNVEVYMEVKPDWGNDSGLFLRSNEDGDAYLVTLDYLPGGGMGGIYGEGLQGVSGQSAPLPEGIPTPRLLWTDVWRRESWNSVRARIEGDVPRIQVWINGAQVRDWKDTTNHAAGGATDGMIAIQIHGGGRALPGGFWRWRNIAVKELP